MRRDKSCRDRQCDEGFWSHFGQYAGGWRWLAVKAVLRRMLWARMHSVLAHPLRGRNSKQEVKRWFIITDKARAKGNTNI